MMAKLTNHAIKIISVASLLLSASFFSNLAAKKNKCAEPITKLIDLVDQPKDYLHKHITIQGEFFSFSTLPLDYEKAMKESKDYIGIVLARPDQKEIPLVELKIAAAIKMFKDEDITVNHGDLVTLEAKVYALALGEPWLEIQSIKVKEANEENSIEQI